MQMKIRIIKHNIITFANKTFSIIDGKRPICKQVCVSLCEEMQKAGSGGRGAMGRMEGWGASKKSFLAVDRLTHALPVNWAVWAVWAIRLIHIPIICTTQIRSIPCKEPRVGEMVTHRERCKKKKESIEQGRATQRMCEMLCRMRKLHTVFQEGEGGQPARYNIMRSIHRKYIAMHILARANRVAGCMNNVSLLIVMTTTFCYMTF